jgi:hypothetical protein
VAVTERRQLAPTDLLDANGSVRRRGNNKGPDDLRLKRLGKPLQDRPTGRSPLRDGGKIAAPGTGEFANNFANRKKSELTKNDIHATPSW